MINIEQIRADFPLLKQRVHNQPLVYLDNSATTQKPAQVIKSITDFYTTLNSNVHRGVHSLSEQASVAFESVRKQIKEFLQAEHIHEIVFTSGTTEAINLIATVYGETNVEKDDEIIITEMEHHANIVPWQMLCKKKKAHLKILPINDDGEVCIEQLPKLISKHTKLIACCYVSNVLGTINPVKSIINIAHTHQIPVLIDAAQAVPHIPVNVMDLDCDFLVFSGHKIYAETGIGVLYAKEKWLKELPPYQYGGGMIEKVRFEQTTFANPPHKFEAGTQNISGVISLGAALEYIEQIGIHEIKNYEDQLMHYALEQLQTLPSITIYGNPGKRCGIISFNIENIHHYDAMMLLDKQGIAVRCGAHCAQPLMDHYNIPGTIRISLSFYNTKDDIDRCITALRTAQEMLTESCVET